MSAELKNASEKIVKISQVDSLTELYNKRYFNEAYLREWESAAHSNYPIALMMVDIDYFKEYNDTYGHLQGDECLNVSIGVAAAIPNGTVTPDMLLKLTDNALYIAKKHGRNCYRILQF